MRKIRYLNYHRWNSVTKKLEINRVRADGPCTGTCSGTGSANDSHNHDHKHNHLWGIEVHLQESVDPDLPEARRHVRSNFSKTRMSCSAAHSQIF